jgi:methyl-accepting chemotaxis protein
MAEIVSSIRRVTDIMGEISAASSEQSAGVAQVGEAVNHMDQATQQNAALVEQMAAAASSLKSQAQDLVQVVATFKLIEGEATRRPAVQRNIAPPRPVAFASSPKRPALSKPAAPKKVAAPRPISQAAAKPISQSAPKAAAISHQTSKADDEEWETF